MSNKIKTLDDIPAISAYLRRIGAEARSLRTAVVTEKSGKYWRDICVITFDSGTGEVHLPKEHEAAYKPTDAEVQRIKDEVGNYDWPHVKLVKRLNNLPPMLEKAPKETVFEFRDTEGNILMLQQRLDVKGEKKYIPWTYWDDNEWRSMEPEGKLPLYGLDQLNDNTTVFIHEGAKAARAVREMVEAQTPDAKAKLKAHPWGDELSGAAHIGWIGGALSPYRTDWSILRKAGVKRAYIVSDNDDSGVSAVAPISQQLRFPTYHVQFTQDWPASFDLADEFPKKMFESVEGKRYYTGPSFRSCTMPATWATDLLPSPTGKGKGQVILREHFKQMWAYVEEVDLFVCIEMPDIIRPEKILNNMLAGFSHVNNTTSLMVRSYRGRQARLAYRPDVKGRIINDRTTAAVNLHTPTHIKAVSGKVAPWEEFMEYLFPVEGERHEVLRWVATLIARPDIRMIYALLLISEKQGMGKSILGERVLNPLVGEQNVSFPNEKDIVDSQFNGWLGRKRLIIVAEIYSGHSWKAYNNLKHFITDKFVDVNEKFERPYLIENWAHFFVSSNSRRALKMEDDDRRWYYPTVTEMAWPRAKFAEFISWLQSGGLSIIKDWAEGWKDYVEPGERAPMTGLKRELIEASRSEAQREVADLARAALDKAEPIALSMKDIEGWVRTAVEGRVFDSDYELRKVMTEVGLLVAKQRIKVAGRLQYVILNNAAYSEVVSVEDPLAYNDKVRKMIKPPNTIIGEQM